MYIKVLLFNQILVAAFCKRPASGSKVHGAFYGIVCLSPFALYPEFPSLFSDVFNIFSKLLLFIM